MRVHRLHCGSHHGLLLETAASLVVVDPGLGLRDVTDPRGRLSSAYRRLNRARLRTDATAARQIHRLGFDPRDVRHVILSHLDCDRAGGLDDFPEATVHLLESEVRAATLRRTALDRLRFRPQQWASRPRWHTYPAWGDMLWGFGGVRRPTGLLADVLLVPLPGHTAGHAGVAVRLSTGWLFYAGDAFYFHGEMHPHHPHCPPHIRLAQWLVTKDHRARNETLQRLRTLVRDASDLTLLCAHDPVPIHTATARLDAVPLPYLEAPARELRPAA